MKTIFLNLDEVLAIHHTEVEKFGGSHGVRDLNLLDSAIQRPESSFMGDDLYPTIFDKVAALMHSILLNHPFVDGNKRTATASAAYFLYLNGYELEVTQEEMVQLALRVESKKIDLEQIAKWFKEYSVKIMS